VECLGGWGEGGARGGESGLRLIFRKLLAQPPINFKNPHSAIQDTRDRQAMEEEIRELYEALEERERNIDELEAVLTNLEGENDKQQDELNARTKELQELQFAVKQLRQDNDGLLEEKSLLVETVNTQKYQLDEQKNLLAVSAKASEEAKKTQKDGNQNLYRLEVENQR